MYWNAIYICIFWYSQIFWFPVKKCWCHQKSRGVSRDSYTSRISSTQIIIVPSFIIVEYVWQILEGRPFFLPHPCVALKNPILNRINGWAKIKSKNLQLLLWACLWIVKDRQWQPDYFGTHSFLPTLEVV